MESNKSTETLSLRTKEKNNKVSKGYSLNNSLQYVKNKSVDSLLSRNIPSSSRKSPSKLTPNQQNTRNKIMSLMKRSSDFVAEIRQTKHYEWFEYVKGNRDIYKSQIKKLARSYSRIILNTKAIICYVDINYKTGKWILKIVDGQHTYETRKIKQMSIPFVIDQALNPNNALEAITEVNSTVKKWINQDFLTSLSMMGKKSYQLFKEVQQKYMPVDNELLFYILNIGERLY